MDFLEVSLIKSFLFRMSGRNVMTIFSPSLSHCFNEYLLYSQPSPQSALLHLSEISIECVALTYKTVQNS